jgi:hypothetical protein
VTGIDGSPGTSNGTGPSSILGTSTNQHEEGIALTIKHTPGPFLDGGVQWLEGTGGRWMENSGGYRHVVLLDRTGEYPVAYVPSDEGDAEQVANVALFTAAPALADAAAQLLHEFDTWGEVLQSDTDGLYGPETAIERLRSAHTAIAQAHEGEAS